MAPADPIIQLPWLCPCATSLAALARSADGTAWTTIRSDPAAVLLIARYAAGVQSLPALIPYFSTAPEVLSAALRHLETVPSPFVDWSLPAHERTWSAALRYAQVAHRLAERIGRGDPDNAWTAGLLAPLAQLAACAGGRPGGPPTAEAITRRLARRWRLPPWLGVTVGHLGLPGETAVALGADRTLYRITQLAVGLVQGFEAGLDLPLGATPREAAEALGVGKYLDAMTAEAGALVREPAPVRTWTAPDRVPFLRDLLVLAVENRQFREAPLVRQLEEQIDLLHQAVAGAHADEEARLLTRKLTALGELAAGAGHEINNPLAVISGQAQYLLKQLPRGENESTPSPFAPALEKIIEQSQHIHQILRGLMQFARPPRPEKKSFDLSQVVHETASALAGLAAERNVTLAWDTGANGVEVFADPSQVQTAVTALLRNAIEAAPSGGWARVRVELAEPQALHVIVEDSGPGPDERACEHMFDPFFSGRSAGRGRGLGLPTAWRLAHQHGGSVRHATPPGGPTRFVLTLPHHAVSRDCAA